MTACAGASRRGQGRGATHLPHAAQVVVQRVRLGPEEVQEPLLAEPRLARVDAVALATARAGRGTRKGGAGGRTRADKTVEVARKVTNEAPSDCAAIVGRVRGRRHTTPRAHRAPALGTRPECPASYAEDRGARPPRGCANGETKSDARVTPSGTAVVGGLAGPRACTRARAPDPHPSVAQERTEESAGGVAQPAARGWRAHAGCDGRVMRAKWGPRTFERGAPRGRSPRRRGPRRPRRRPPRRRRTPGGAARGGALAARGGSRGTAPRSRPCAERTRRTSGRVRPAAPPPRRGARPPAPSCAAATCARAPGSARGCASQQHNSRR